MKKLLALLLALCLIFAGVAGYLGGKEPGISSAISPSDSYAGTDGTVESEVGAEDIPSLDEADSSLQLLDFEAMYALHAPEDTVLRIGGKDVPWSEYFYMFYSQASYVEEYFIAMASYYGLNFSWYDLVDEDNGISYMDWVLSYTEDALKQHYTILSFAEENGVVLPEEIREELAQTLAEDIAATCGEGATEEDFWDYLSQQYLTRELYEDINEVNYFYQQGYTQLYGETGEKYDETAAMAWLEDAGYLSASHILLATIDLSTGEALDEATVQAKRSQAEAILEELGSIEETEALVARFRELKDEYCEDGGKVTYPDGYTFTPGTMVDEFEDALNALADYELSDIVETSYGYHIILRLPLRVDSALFGLNAADGTPMTALSQASNEEYGQRLQAAFDEMSVEYVNGFQPPVLTNYILK